MYDLLTNGELCVLQSMLYEGTEDAYRAAYLRERDASWVAHYRPMHREIAYLFIEAGSELVDRLSQPVVAA